MTLNYQKTIDGIIVSAATKQQKSAKRQDEKKPLSVRDMWNDLHQRHPNALLLFRVGDFYELYNEHAVKGAEILGITLCQGNDAWSNISGFPAHMLDTYLPKLIRAGQRVAICDELKPKKS